MAVGRFVDSEPLSGASGNMMARGRDLGLSETRNEIQIALHKRIDKGLVMMFCLRWVKCVSKEWSGLLCLGGDVGIVICFCFKRLCAGAETFLNSPVCGKGII